MVNRQEGSEAAEAATKPRQKIKFLVAIWGTKYINEFAQVALPSFLSPGNIPALAAAADVEVVVMTTEASRMRLVKHPQFVRLRGFCPIKYLYIDDLITNGNYGVTLTFAFARAIRDSGEEQTNTTFVFMNSDFILADGALKTLLAKLEEGHRCVMAPSLRASSEVVLPLLKTKVNKRTGALTMGAREMVQLTFDNLHPTVIAKTVTQSLSTCKTHNQIYWQVDETALLGRYHLIFMLAIKPEVPLGPINSYCDYGFVPEMVPSGQFIVLDDSDDFFMLELQATHQEGDLLRGGTSSPQEIARQLSTWTTPEHRRFAEWDVLFRTGDLPPNLEEERGRFHAFIASVKRHIRKEAISHVDHYYWVLGLLAWGTLKSNYNTLPLTYPPEIDHPYSPDDIKGAMVRLSDDSRPVRLSHLPRRIYLGAIARLRRASSNQPFAPVWDHLWQDFRLVRSWAAAHRQAPGEKTLVLLEESSPLDRVFGARPGYDIKRGFDDLAPSEPTSEQEAFRGAYSTLFLHIYRANMRSTRRLLAEAEYYLKPGARIVIFVEHRQSEVDPSDFTAELTHYLTEFLPSNWTRYQSKALFVGGRAKRKLRLWERRIFERMKAVDKSNIGNIVLGVVAWPVVAAATVVNNLRHSTPSGACPEYCSAFLISLERRPGAALPAPATAR